MMRFRWLALAALVPFSLACSDFFSLSDTDRTMTLVGTVTDASTSEPLEGVLVSLGWVPADTIGAQVKDHIDVFTSATGDYLLETKLGNVSCHTLELFFATGGYQAAWSLPKCKGGKQRFDAALRPD